MLAYVAKLGIGMFGVHYRVQKLVVFVTSSVLLDIACLGLRVFLKPSLQRHRYPCFYTIILCHYAVFLGKGVNVHKPFKDSVN